MPERELTCPAATILPLGSTVIAAANELPPRICVVTAPLVPKAGSGRTSAPEVAGATRAVSAAAVPASASAFRRTERRSAESRSPFIGGKLSSRRL